MTPAVFASETRGLTRVGADASKSGSLSEAGEVKRLHQKASGKGNPGRDAGTVVDGRAFNSFFWVFYGALSDVEYTITVTDTVTGAVKVYSNPQGQLASVADVAAF